MHVWDSLLLNPTNYTIWLCLIISALAGIKTEARFLICCTTLPFRVPILPSEAAPTRARETLWVPRRGRWDGDLGLFFLSCVCVISSGLCIVPSSWDSRAKPPALTSECNCVTISVIFKAQCQKEERCLWAFWVPRRLKM